MTKERAKKLLPIITAFAEGKTIQIKCEGEHKGWVDVVSETCYFDNSDCNWRIKPQPREFYILFDLDFNTRMIFDSKDEVDNHVYLHKNGQYNIIKVIEVQKEQ